MRGKHLKHFCFIFIFVLSGLVWAGVDSSGGGPSVVRFNSNGQIVDAKSLDLFEGPINFQLTILEQAGTTDEIVLRTVEKVKQRNLFIGLELEDNLREIEKKWVFLPKGVMMAPGVDLGDSYMALIPTGYQLFYTGYYQENGILRISWDIYQKLSPTHQAALKIHEAFYKMARWFSDTKNSISTRQITAYVFSTADLQDLSDEFIQNFIWRYFWPDPHSGFTAEKPLLLENDGSDFFFKLLEEDMSVETLFQVECQDGLSNPKPITQAKFFGMSELKVPAISPRTGQPCRGFAVYSSNSTGHQRDNPVEVKYGSKLIHIYSSILQNGFSGSKRLPIYWR